MSDVEPDPEVPDDVAADQAEARDEAHSLEALSAAEAEDLAELLEEEE
jgi:hypothetical protein